MIYSYINGVRTAIEIKDDPVAKEEAEKQEAQNPPDPTMEDRMVKVEQEIEDLSYVITGEVAANAQ